MLDGLEIGNWVLILQLQELRVVQVKEPCIEFTQENSIENSVQDSLPYISFYMDHASYCVPYPKLPYVSLKVNIHCACYITSSFQNVLHPSICLMPSLTLTLSSKNRKNRKNKIKMRKENKKN